MNIVADISKVQGLQEVVDLAGWEASEQAQFRGYSVTVSKDLNLIVCLYHRQNLKAFLVPLKDDPYMFGRLIREIWEEVGDLVDSRLKERIYEWVKRSLYPGFEEMLATYNKKEWQMFDITWRISESL